MSRNKLTGVQLLDIKQEVRNNYIKLENVNRVFLERYSEMLREAKEGKEIKEIIQKEDGLGKTIADSLVAFVLKSEIVDKSDIDTNKLREEILSIPYLKNLAKLMDTQLGKVLYNMLFPVILRFLQQKGGAE